MAPHPAISGSKIVKTQAAGLDTRRVETNCARRDSHGSAAGSANSIQHIEKLPVETLTVRVLPIPPGAPK